MTIVLPDPIAAICAYLKAQPIVAGTLDRGPDGPLIYRPDLPQTADKDMPQACVVARPAGGYQRYGKTTFYVADPRIDFVCFGATQQQATGVARAVATVLKQLTFPSVWENTLLYSAEVSGGPTPLPDTQTLWPACWVAATVMHGELPAGE